MSEILLEATTRTNTGKGASRRLRRLDNKFPAIVYGGNKDSLNIEFAQNKAIKALEDEAIYSSVFDIKVDGKVEHVILKDIQRHPYKPVILHMDLQRVNPKDVIIKVVPLHFINEKKSKGVKLGGIVNHIISSVEVKCLARNLPAFIEVNVAKLEMDQTIHLSQIKLPKNVQLTADLSDSAHDHAVVSVHMPKAPTQDEEESDTEDDSEASDASDATDPE